MNAKVAGVKNKRKPRGQWFMECNAFANESVQRLLAEWGISDAESKHTNMPGSDGKPHDVILVPSSFVNRMRGTKEADKRFKSASGSGAARRGKSPRPTLWKSGRSARRSMRLASRSSLCRPSKRNEATWRGRA